MSATEKKILVVTSWSPAGFELYGKDWVESAGKYWPPNMIPFVVTDEDLTGDPDFVAFMQRHAQRKMDERAIGYDYRQDLVRFSHKIFALKVAIDQPGLDEYDWLIWLDGDVTTKAKVTQEFIASILNESQDGVLLSRVQSAPHPECGFMAFNMRRDGLNFLRRYIGMFVSDAVLGMPELHDSHVFMAAVVAHNQMPGVSWLDLAPHGVGPLGLDAFEASPLHSFFVHRKGIRKYTESAPLANTEIIARLLGGSIGVNMRAGEEGVSIRPSDAVIIMDCVGAPVEDVKKSIVALGPTPTIYIGYYSSDAEGKHVDDTRYGVNNARGNLVVFESTEEAPGGRGFVHVAVGNEFEPIPAGIPLFTHRTLTPITKDHIKGITNDAYSTNMLVQTQNCAPDEEIHTNIRENLSLITKWITNVHPHRRRAIVVSGGPSLKLPETMAEIRREIAEGAVVLCVKHSHRYLIEQGIIPWACVLLDPRPHDGLSTHGQPRRELLPAAVPGVRYLVASMVHPSTTKRLLETGGNVYGWHAAVGANEKSVLPPEHVVNLMGGGTSSAGRAMLLCWQFLGFQSIGLYAFDSCHLSKDDVDMTARHQDGTPKYFEMAMAVSGRSKTFLTDRDILCQCQDFTRFNRECPWIQWDAHGPGMVAWLWENTKGVLPQLEEMLR